MVRPVNQMRPVHPGEVLREDYLLPLGLSVNALAVALGVPATRIHEIVKERRAVTADTAARLAKYFGGDAVSWLVMQANYDLKTLPTYRAFTVQIRYGTGPSSSHT
jgi:addiction module HigA family antidote